MSIPLSRTPSGESRESRELSVQNNSESITLIKIFSGAISGIRMVGGQFLDLFVGGADPEAGHVWLYLPTENKELSSPPLSRVPVPRA